MVDVTKQIIVAHAFYRYKNILMHAFTDFELSHKYYQGFMVEKLTYLKKKKNLIKDKAICVMPLYRLQDKWTK